MYLLTFHGQNELLRRWDWHRLVELALIGGWSPRTESAVAFAFARRQARGGRVFGGVDVPHEAVTIEREDSARLADALEGVLADVPDHSAAAQKSVEIVDLSASLHSRRVWPHEIITALEDFSGRRKRIIREWVRIFRVKGGFMVRYLGPKAGA